LACLLFLCATSLAAGMAVPIFAQAVRRGAISAGLPGSSGPPAFVVRNVTQVTLSERASFDSLSECDSCQGLIDYPRVMAASPLGYFTGAGLLLWALALIWLLNSTAQDFFVPPLVYWSELLHLTPEVAGATLVALGNGAPDAFAMVSATQARDTPLAFDTLLGGMMCVLCITAGGVLLTAEGMRGAKAGARAATAGGPPASALTHEAGMTAVHGPPGIEGHEYWESIVCLLAALAYLAFLLRDGVVTTARAASMPLLYLLYLAFLIWNRRGPEVESAALKARTSPQADTSRPMLQGLAFPLNGSLLELSLWALAWPTYAVRWALIPPSDLHWDRFRRVVSSFAPLGMAVFCSGTYLDGLQSLVATPAATGITTACLAASLGIFLGSDDGPAVPWFYPAITLIAKASSILVLSVIAGELTACVETLGTVIGVPRLWLGTTVIAWGNSLGDLVTGVAMVKQGQTCTAFTSVFAGPLFNFLCGAGMALTMAACSRGGKVHLWETPEGMMDLRVHVRFLISASFLLVLMLLCRQHYCRLWPFALFALYAIFLVCVLSMEQADG